MQQRARVRRQRWRAARPRLPRLSRLPCREGPARALAGSETHRDGAMPAIVGKKRAQPEREDALGDKRCGAGARRAGLWQRLGGGRLPAVAAPVSATGALDCRMAIRRPAATPRDRLRHGATPGIPSLVLRDHRCWSGSAVTLGGQAAPYECRRPRRIVTRKSPRRWKGCPWASHPPVRQSGWMRRPISRRVDWA